MWTRAAFRFERAVPAALAPSLGTPWRPPAAPPVPRAPDGGVDSAACARFVAPVARHREAPLYPREHVLSGQGGRVVMRMLVGLDGRPSGITVGEATDALFEEAAVRAVARWRFTPAVCDGVPSEFVVTIPINFRQSR